jgi:thiamine-monophosphate kinase
MFQASCCPILSKKMRIGRGKLIQGEGELALLERIQRRASRYKNSTLRLGIGDDCAILRLEPEEELAVTTDLSISGRHFRLDLHSPEVIGHRALARGLSDIAAMGARPVAAFLSLGLPQELTAHVWIDRFLDGFFRLAVRHKVPLAGGDLAESPIAITDIVLLGAAPLGQALRRSGAKPGDRLYVTGVLGGAAAGLELLGKFGGRSAAARIRARDRESLSPHLWPEPRITQALWLRSRGKATAAIDVSDGLSSDLRHLCQESGVAAEVEAEALPVAQGAILHQALHGGEDYELLFTAKPGTKIPSGIAGVPITQIGRIVKRLRGRPAVVLLKDAHREPLERGGWEHFS